LSLITLIVVLNMLSSLMLQSYKLFVRGNAIYYLSLAFSFLLVIAGTIIIGVYNYSYSLPVFFLAVLCLVDLVRFQGSDFMDISYYIVLPQSRITKGNLFLMTELLNAKLFLFVTLIVTVLFVNENLIPLSVILLTALVFIIYTYVNSVFILLARRIMIISHLYRVVPNMISVPTLIFMSQSYLVIRKGVKNYGFLPSVNDFMLKNINTITIALIIAAIVASILYPIAIQLIIKKVPLQNQKIVTKNRKFFLSKS